MDYGQYYYKSSEEYALSSDIEQQLMAVQELIDQGVVSCLAYETPIQNLHLSLVLALPSEPNPGMHHDERDVAPPRLRATIFQRGT